MPEVKAYALRNLIHAYEKCCILSGYIGVTDTKLGEDDGG